MHLGDFTHIEVANFLRTFGPLHAVHGNNDREEVRTQFPQRIDLDLEGFHLSLLHGDEGGRTALAAARAVRDADLVLFGHSHRPWNARENGTLLFNPGSPTDRRWFPYPSFGIIDLEPTRLDATIVPLLSSGSG